MVIPQFGLASYDSTLMKMVVVIDSIDIYLEIRQIIYVSKRECRIRNIEIWEKSSGDERPCETVVDSTNK